MITRWAGSSFPTFSKPLLHLGLSRRRQGSGNCLLWHGGREHDILSDNRSEVRHVFIINVYIYQTIFHIDTMGSLYRVNPFNKGQSGSLNEDMINGHFLLTLFVYSSTPHYSGHLLYLLFNCTLFFRTKETRHGPMLRGLLTLHSTPHWTEEGPLPSTSWVSPVEINITVSPPKGNLVPPNHHFWRTLTTSSGIRVSGG